MIKLLKNRLGKLLPIGIFVFALFFIMSEVQAYEVQGIYGLVSDEEGGYFAVKIQIPENQALSGILWYNNDQEIVFPSVKVGTGYPHSPGLVEDFFIVAQGIQGENSAWSEVAFSEPIAASLGSLYLAIELPPLNNLTSTGFGGGAGIGYLNSNEGCPGWLSGEGEVWGRLHQDYSFAVQPIFVPQEEGMAIKSLGGEGTEVPDPVIANYLKAFPNPFNPVTHFSYGLTDPGSVTVDVYDVRGRHVVELVDGFFIAGRHSVEWYGLDSAGQRVSSGVYFAHLKAEGFELKQKVLLVK